MCGAMRVWSPYWTGRAPCRRRRILLPQVETLLRFEHRKDPQDSLKVSVSLDDTVGGPPCPCIWSPPLRRQALPALDRVFTNGPVIQTRTSRTPPNTLFRYPGMPAKGRGVLLFFRWRRTCRHEGKPLEGYPGRWRLCPGTIDPEAQSLL